MRVCLLLILGSETTDLVQFLWPEQALPESEMRVFGNEERQQTVIYLKSLVLAAEQGNVKEILEVRDHLGALLTETESVLFSILLQLYSY